MQGPTQSYLLGTEGDPLEPADQGGMCLERDDPTTYGRATPEDRPFRSDFIKFNRRNASLQDARQAHLLAPLRGRGQSHALDGVDYFGRGGRGCN